MTLTLLDWLPELEFRSLQMSLTLLGWLLLVSTVAITALLMVPLRSSGSLREQLDLEVYQVRLEDSAERPVPGSLNEAEADPARPAPLSRLLSSSFGFGRDVRGPAGALIAAAAVFLVVAGIGAATYFLGDPPEATGSGEATSFSPPGSGPGGEMLARLQDYTRSIGAEEPASTAAAGKLLPDVNTMTERLAARLETTPNDVKGWRMLGWSYFNTGRYEQAAAAYARAVKLDPNSAELKLSYEEAKAKASGLDVERATKSGAMPAREQDAAIRSMVDGLANRLESSPRDVEGWTRLMRSRVVLGEREAAATAFRKALEVFKDDQTASGTIAAAAIELGLKAE